MYKYFISMFLFSSQVYSLEVDVQLALLSEEEQEKIYNDKLQYYAKDIQNLKSRINECGEDNNCVEHFKKILRDEEVFFAEAKAILDSSDSWKYGLNLSLVQNKVLKSNDFDFTSSCIAGNPKYSRFTFANLDLQKEFYKTKTVHCTIDREYFASCEYYDENISNSIYVKSRDALVEIIGELNYDQSQTLIKAWAKTEQAKEKEELKLSSIQLDNGNVIFYPSVKQCGDTLRMYTYELINGHSQSPKLGRLLYK